MAELEKRDFLIIRSTCLVVIGTYFSYSSAELRKWLAFELKFWGYISYLFDFIKTKHK